MESFDFTNKQHDDHSCLWVSMSLIYKTFRDFPQLCFHMLSLLFPARSGRVLKVPLLQEGLQSPVLKHVTADMVAGFSQDMGKSNVARVAAKLHNAGQAGDETGSGNKRNSDLLGEATSSIDGVSTLASIMESKAYLEKIDPTNSNIDDYVILACLLCKGT